MIAKIIAWFRPAKPEPLTAGISCVEQKCFDVVGKSLSKLPLELYVRGTPDDKPDHLAVMKALEQYRVAQFSNSPAVRKAASDALDRAKGRKA